MHEISNIYQNFACIVINVNEMAAFNADHGPDRRSGHPCTALLLKSLTGMIFKVSVNK